MLRLISASMLLIVMLIFSVFAIINRDLVRVNFDFFSLFDMDVSQPQAFLVIEAPLFLIVFAAVLIGMCVGMLLPLMNFFRKKSRALQEKLNQPLAPPPLQSKENIAREN